MSAEAGRLLEPQGVGAGQPASVNRGSGKLSTFDLKKGNERKLILQAAMPLWDAHSLEDVAVLVGVSAATLCRLRQQFGHLKVEELTVELLEGNTRACGRKPNLLPNAAELACVRELYVRLDESVARGRGLGSSKIAAYRIAAKSDDSRIGELFKNFVLQRRSKRLPESWLRLLQTSAAVVDRGRDKRSTMTTYISTPRGRTYVNLQGEEVALRCGSIFEPDDGTLNFYAYVPWPFGGDPCSEKYGVKLARWQLLAAVDYASRCCLTYDVVCRNKSSYRAEDSAALLGRTMLEEGIPELWRTERGSWEAARVRDPLEMLGVPQANAWESKQKEGVENFFDRLWTPASLIPGHVGRDRGRYKQTTDLAMACEAGRRDPRDYFLSLDDGMKQIQKAVHYANTEPIESKSGWGTWVPQERWTQQTGAHPLVKLDESMRIFFAREQREWTVRKACLGGMVDGPDVKFPTYFQCAELAMFEGCKVKCYFDPYAERVTGTLVLQHDWREHKTGTIIAADVPALDLPPQAILADNWSGEAEHAKSLAIRKAISKSVRTEYCNWRGQRTSEARDGLGNTASRTVGASSSATAAVPQRINRSLAAMPTFQPRETIPEITADRRERLARQAERANRLSQLQT